MFFDRGSARHLNHSIKTLGDPSFNVSYSRDYDAIALNPEIFGSPGNKLGEFRGSVLFLIIDLRWTKNINL